MKLKYYSEQTFPKQAGRGNTTPRVSIGKSGVIQFNGAATTLIGLKSGDKVTIAQDEEDKDNWFVFKDNAHGFELRPGYDAKKTKGALMMNHKKLQVHICKFFKINDDETQRFLIAGQPTLLNGDKTKYWGLLLKPKV